MNRDTRPTLNPTCRTLLLALAMAAVLTLPLLLADNNSSQPADNFKQPAYPNRLYLDNTTYIQIHPSDARPREKKQPTVQIAPSFPRNQTTVPSDWLPPLPNGNYTLEILTHTPHNKGKPQRLAHCTFSVKRGKHTPDASKKPAPSKPATL